MTENTFSRVGQTDQRLYGPRGLLVCGYAAAEQQSIHTLLAALEIDDLPLVFATTDHLPWPIARIFALEGGAGQGEDSLMRRAVIMSGISESELHRIMGGYRSLELPAQLWATLTPVSKGWLLEDLLEELAAERQAMERRQAQARPGKS
jgi:hypothetical protein